MANKYKQSLIESAELLDKELQNDSFYTRQIIRIFDSDDDAAAKKICDQLAATAHNGEKEIKEKAKYLKD